MPEAEVLNPVHEIVTSGTDAKGLAGNPKP